MRRKWDYIIQKKLVNRLKTTIYLSVGGSLFLWFWTSRDDYGQQGYGIGHFRGDGGLDIVFTYIVILLMAILILVTIGYIIDLIFLEFDFVRKKYAIKKSRIDEIYHTIDCKLMEDEKSEKSIYIFKRAKVEYDIEYNITKKNYPCSICKPEIGEYLFFED